MIAKIVKENGIARIVGYNDSGEIIHPEIASRPEDDMGDLIQLCTEFIEQADGTKITGIHPFIYTPE